MCVCLSVRPPVYLSMHQSLYPSTHLPTNPLTHFLICPSTYSIIYPLTHLFHPTTPLTLHTHTPTHLCTQPRSHLPIIFPACLHILLSSLSFWTSLALLRPAVPNFVGGKNCSSKEYPCAHTCQVVIFSAGSTEIPDGLGSWLLS